LYGLKQDYFEINPKKEFHIFFARGSEFDTFYQDMMGTLDSGRVPRYVVFGLFGVGKTHFLHHLKYRIGDKADLIYLETPASHRRTSFIEFYRTIISTLGRATVIELLKERLKSHAKTAELGLTQDILYVIDNAIKANLSFVLWKFLSGEKLKAADAEKLEAVRPELSVEDAVSVLKAIIYLYEKSRGKPLVLLVDEFETTMHIGGDAKVSFTEAVRSIVDESSRVGVIFALTARALAEMPSALHDEPVKRRIGVTNYIEFHEYKEDELERFLLEAIEYRRDPSFDVKKSLSRIEGTEAVDAQTYPFSREALKEIVASIALLYEQHKIEAMRPKEGLEIMDKALRLAIGKRLPFIGKDTILEVRDQVVEALRL
jgi:Cdc6-like AAA superfamily ATPase